MMNLATLIVRAVVLALIVAAVWHLARHGTHSCSGCNGCPGNGNGNGNGNGKNAPDCNTCSRCHSNQCPSRNAKH